MKLVIEIPDNIYRNCRSIPLSPVDCAIKNGKPLDTVLGEIKAEIETNKEKWWYGVNDDCFMKLSDVLKIIDQYKAERGGEE